MWSVKYATYMNVDIKSGELRIARIFSRVCTAGFLVIEFKDQGSRIEDQGEKKIGEREDGKYNRYK